MCEQKQKQEQPAKAGLIVTRGVGLVLEVNLRHRGSSG